VLFSLISKFFIFFFHFATHISLFNALISTSFAKITRIPTLLKDAVDTICGIGHCDAETKEN